MIVGGEGVFMEERRKKTEDSTDSVRGREWEINLRLPGGLTKPIDRSINPQTNR